MELLLLDAVFGPLLGCPVKMKLVKSGVVNGTFKSYSVRRVGRQGEEGIRICLEVATGGSQEIDFDIRDILEVTRTEGVVVFNTGFGSITIATIK